MNAVKVAHQMDFDLFKVRSDESAVRCRDKSLAKQSFAEECDINSIVRKFGITGQMPTNVRQPMWGDFAGISDFHSAANAIALANESFDALPAEVRSRFENDPGAFVDFALARDKDGKLLNQEQLDKWGMVAPEKVVVQPPLKSAAETVVPPAGTPEAVLAPVKAPGAQ